jgi:hypothetical protein
LCWIFMAAAQWAFSRASLSESPHSREKLTNADANASPAPMLSRR